LACVSTDHITETTCRKDALTLAAKGGKEDNEFNGVNVVRDQNERGLLVLNKSNNVVETVLDDVGLLADVLLGLTLGHSGGLLVETLLLVGGGLGAVLVEELESLGSGVAVEDVGELGKCRGNLEAHVENLALALEADVGGPLDHAREVAVRLDVLADTVVTRAALDEGVLRGLG